MTDGVEASEELIEVVGVTCGVDTSEVLIEVFGVCDVIEGWSKSVLEKIEGVIGGSVMATVLRTIVEDARDTVMGAGLEYRKIISQLVESSLANRTLKKTLSCFSRQSLLQFLHQWRQPPTGWIKAIKARI